jgi:hypothetical protein
LTTNSETFIDSLLNVSDSLYVQNNISDTFYYANCDTQSNYSSDTDTHPDEYSEIFQNDFDSNIKYPVGYIKRPNYDSSAFVDVHLYVGKTDNAVITAIGSCLTEKQITNTKSILKTK